MTAHGFDIVSLRRWVGGPGGHEEEVGIVAFDPMTDQPVWVDATLDRIIRADLADGWTRREFERRFHADRMAVAYGDAYLVAHTSLGIQYARWTLESVFDEEATLAIGTDCRDDSRAPWPDADVVTFATPPRSDIPEFMRVYPNEAV